MAVNEHERLFNITLRHRFSRATTPLSLVMLEEIEDTKGQSESVYRRRTDNKMKC